MYTQSTAAMATQGTVVRTILIFCFGQLMVSTANTAEAKDLEENKSRQLPPVIPGYIAHQTGKYWNTDQCPHLLTTVDDSLDSCANDCTGTTNCTAFIFSETHKDCSMFTCPIPAPKPAGNFTGLVAYSMLADCSFNNQVYTDGNTILDQAFCALLECDGGTGQFTFLGYDRACQVCLTYWDPHILTYDRGDSRGSFDYQKCGKFSLTQSDTSYDPTYAVYATFVQNRYFDASITVVGTVHLKIENTIVTIVYENDELIIQVNDIDVDVNSLSTSPRLLQDVSQTEYPVLAWLTSTYTPGTYIGIYIQGSNGFLVYYRGNPYTYANHVYVWAHPDVVNAGLYGICGNANGDAFDDLTTRDGSLIPVFQRDSRTRWQASPNDGDGSCPLMKFEVNTTSQNRCELDPSVQERLFNQCSEAVGNGFSQEGTNLEIILIDDCVYDLCNVTNVTAWMETIRTTVQVQAEIQNNTKESLITTKAPIIQTTQTTTQPPTEPTTKPPTEPTTKPPTDPTTKPPTEFTTQSPTQTTTQPTIQPTTQPPTEDRCEGNEGWRGKCFGNQYDLSTYKKCDLLIKNATGCEEEQTCCVDCSLLNDLCEQKWTDSMARGSPCPRCERKMGEIRLGSGCSCCKKCKRTQKCKNRNGICISDEDPVHNRGWCKAQEGKIRKGLCKGPGCFCCVRDRT